MANNINNNIQQVSVTVPWLSFLGIAFVVLKLLHVISWSWFWVTMPFWISFAIIFGIFAIWMAVLVVIFIVGVIADFIRAISQKFRKRV